MPTQGCLLPWSGPATWLHVPVPVALQARPLGTKPTISKVQKGARLEAAGTGAFRYNDLLRARVGAGPCACPGKNQDYICHTSGDHRGSPLQGTVLFQPED